MLGTNSLPHTWQSLTETGTWCALYVTVFSSCPLYLDYFDSKRAHTVMHPRLCMSPLLPKGNSGTYGRWLMERMHEGVGGQRRGKKTQEEHKGSSRSSSILESTHLEQLPTVTLLSTSSPLTQSALTPIQLLRFPLLSLQSLHILASLSSKSESLGLLSSNCIFI